MLFKDREEAGNLLSSRLHEFKKENNLVIGITRGGVITAKAVAKNLKLVLDIIVVKKIGAPLNPELAIGAVGPEKTIFWDEDLCKELGIPESQKTNLKEQKLLEQKDREQILRGDKPYEVKDKIVILVDDGVATGTTAVAAAKFLRKKGAKEIILAIPVIAKDTLFRLKRYFDEVIYLDSVQDFYAVSQFYQEFPQVSDDEVIDILNSKL